MLDRIYPGEISLKQQLRALIIEIQRMIAKIEMIKFKNRSLWDCRVCKKPLKEIVIDIEVDMAEIEKLIAKDKKRSRDRHELTSTWYCRYRGNSLESQKISPDVGENPEEDSLEFVKSSEDSLKFEHQAKGNIVNSNADMISNVDCDCANMEAGIVCAKEDGDTLMSKFETENPIDEALREVKKSNCYTKPNEIIEYPVKLPEETEEMRVHSVSNVNSNVNKFKCKLKRDCAKRKRGKKLPTSDPEIENAPERLAILPDDGSRSKRKEKNAKTTKNKNWNLNSNLNANIVSSRHKQSELDNEEAKKTSDLLEKTSYNSRDKHDIYREYYQCAEKFCKNWQKFVGEVKGTDTNPHAAMNSGSTQNSYRIPTSVNKKSEEISPDDFGEKSQVDTSEEDNHSSTDLPFSCTDSSEDDETSTEDNRINRQINSDVLITRRDDEDDLKAHHGTLSTNRTDAERILKNYIYNQNYNKISKLDLQGAKSGNDISPNQYKEKDSRDDSRETDLNKITIASDVEIVDDNDLEETIDKRVDSSDKLFGDAGISLTEPTEAENEKLNQKHLLMNKNLNLNASLNKLLALMHRKKRTRNAPQIFKRNAPSHPNKKRRHFEEEASVIRNESKTDEREANSMDILIDTVDEAWPIRTRRTVTRDSMRNSKGDGL